MSVMMAVLYLWEVLAGAGEGGAALVETVGVVDVLTTGLARHISQSIGTAERLG